MIKPSFWKNEALADLGPWHRLLFIGLWGLADREGRLEDRPRRIQAEVFPYDEGLDVDAMLFDLAEAEFAVRYQEAGARYIWLPTFEKHQRPHVSEPASVIPTFDGTTEKVVLATEKVVPPTEKFVTNGTLRTRSGTLRTEKAESAALAKTATATTALAVSSPAVLTFPTIGAAGKSWPLTQKQLDEWAELYPTLNVLAEMRQALAWIGVHPDRRKTPGGMGRFCVRWLNKSADRKVAPTLGSSKADRTVESFKRTAGEVVDTDTVF